jgi:hypothetical protein
MYHSFVYTGLTFHTTQPRQPTKTALAYLLTKMVDILLHKDCQDLSLTKTPLSSRYFDLIFKQGSSMHSTSTNPVWGSWWWGGVQLEKGGCRDFELVSIGHGRIYFLFQCQRESEHYCCRGQLTPNRNKLSAPCCQYARLTAFSRVQSCTRLIETVCEKIKWTR